MNKKTLLSITVILCSLCVKAQNVMDITGKWIAELTTQEQGKITRDVVLPGSLLTNDLGDELSVDTKWTGSLYDSSYYFNPYMAKYRIKGKMKFPFFLTPNKHFVGHVTYKKTVTVPKGWKNKRITMFLERPHIETTLYINGKEVGHEMSLSVPHQYDITPYIIAGTENQITIDVYNGIENVCVGQDSHSVTDQTQGNWNGIVGKMEIRTSPLNKKDKGCEVFNNYKVYPDLATGNVKVVFSDTTISFKIDNPSPWSEFTPVVYHRSVTYRGQQIPLTFGFRDITIKGRQFYLNGNPIWVRGTVENCNFPLTGYPPTDVDSWLTIIKKCKEYGLNTMRFHSYCPPEAAFIAADSLGFYLQPEGPSWPNHGVKLRRGMYIDTYLMNETKSIIDTYGNHPSFVMLSAGNEPAGDWVSWCNDWVEEMKKYDSRRVYCGANVGGGWAWDSKSQYHVKGGARGLDWDKAVPQSTDNFNDMMLRPRNFKPTDEHPVNTEPYISHEQGQWCVFPDLKERSQYTGVYKAKNFDIFEDLLKDNGMGQMAGKFLMASGKLQVLAYKYEMERNLRTKDYAGFVLLGLNDYSGQGTALVGPLNVFWREKGYVDSKEWRQFCNTVVPLAKFPKFVFTAGETAEIPFDVYQAGINDLKDAKLKVNGKEYNLGDLKAGKHENVVTVALNTNATKATKCTLTAELTAGGERYENKWDYWVYPQEKTIEVDKKGYAGNKVLVTDTLDAKAMKVLQKGGKVLITAAGKVKYGSDVRQTYLPVFWNTSWFKMRPPHTTGAVIDNSHPIFKEFPSDDWTNLNWWELVNRAQVMNLAEMPKDYQSPVQPIDTWHISRKLGMIVEAKVMKGKVLMTTMDISSNLDKRVVAKQMRKAIIDYMSNDDEFNPEMVLEPKVITDLFEKQAPAVDMYTKDSPDELKPKLSGK